MIEVCFKDYGNVGIIDRLFKKYSKILEIWIIIIWIIGIQIIIKNNK